MPTHAIPARSASARSASALVAMLALAGCSGGNRAPSAPTTPTAPAPNVPERAPRPDSWNLVFSDEFDVDGSPDPARWTYDLGYIANNEAQYYTSRSENVRIEDGRLVIEAIREPWAGYDYTSGRLKTEGIAEFLYGRVEVRAKLPTGRGTWPAIWMLGRNISQVGWPRCGEIDIMENVGFDPDTIVGSVHTSSYNHVQGTQRNASIPVTGPAPYEDFHVYALEWYPDRIDVFVEDQLFFTFQNEGTGSDAWPFDQPHFLILNLAIGGSWGGQQGIDDSLFPHRFEIDYVRVFEAG